MVTLRVDRRLSSFDRGPVAPDARAIDDEADTVDCYPFEPTERVVDELDHVHAGVTAPPHRLDPDHAEVTPSPHTILQ
jgi:hypothetical protein